MTAQQIPGSTPPAKTQFFPSHPTKENVSPARLNAHEEIFTSNIVDLQTAFKALVLKLQAGKIATGTIAGNSSATVTVVWPTAYKDTNYAAVASVEGTSLSVTNVLRSAGTLKVTVSNSSGSSQTGTVMAIAFHF